MVQSLQNCLTFGILIKNGCCQLDAQHLVAKLFSQLSCETVLHVKVLAMVKHKKLNALDAIMSLITFQRKQEVTHET